MIVELLQQFNATSIAFEKDPSAFSYNQDCMRKHLLKYLEKKGWNLFLLVRNAECALLALGLQLTFSATADVLMMRAPW